LRMRPTIETDTATPWRPSRVLKKGLVRGIDG